MGMLDAKMEKTEVLPILHLGTVDQIFDIEVEGDKVYRDDLTGQLLDRRPVREARRKELDVFESKGVWTKRAIDEARRRTGKPPITVRWVDVNKGDDTNPNISSRLVARQIRQPGEEAILTLHPRSSP